MGILIFFKISLQLCYVHYYVHSCSTKKQKKKNIYIHMYLLHTKPANVSCFIQLTQSMLQQQLFTNQSIQIQLNHFNAKYITINYILVSIHLIWLFGASTSLLAFYLGPGVYIAKTWFSYFTYMHMYSVHSHMHTKLLPHNNVYIQHWCIHTYINTRNSTFFVICCIFIAFNSFIWN